MNPEFLLTIDQGNGHTDAILFKAGVEVQRAPQLGDIFHLVKQYQLTSENCRAIISNVTKAQFQLLKLPTQEIGQWFKQNNFLDMPVNYTLTLGQDRLVTAYFAYKQFESAWVIDSGSFTTVDFVDLNGLHGGYIFPGLKIIQSSYATGQNLFSSSELLWEMPHELPHDSKQAIDQGASLTFFAPIYQAIQQRPFQTILVTGGNGKLVAEALQSQLPTASILFNADLLHLSLQQIAEVVTKT